MATVTSLSRLYTSVQRAFGVSSSLRAAGFAATVLTLVSSLAAAPASATLPANVQMDLRVLVLSADGTEPTFAAWKAALDREGVPYDAVIANTADPILPVFLSDSPTHARYQAVVLATGNLYQCTSICTSALDPSEWAALDAYEAKFGVRVVTAYAYPTPDYGLNWPFQSGDISGAEGTMTAAGLASFPYLKGLLPFEAGTWGYYAEPLPPATGAVAFQTLVAGPVGPGGTASALVGVNTHANGIQEMIITYDYNQYQLQSLILSHGLIDWATKGVHLGYNRAYFMAHIDDIFLPDDRWDVAQHVTHEDDGATLPLIRMVASDIDRVLAWQKATGLQLDFVFNGGGSDDEAAANTTTVVNGKRTKTVKGHDALLDRALQFKKEFNWINHTYSHVQLDLVSEADILSQVADNFTWAKAKGIPVEQHVLVTGEHSGLANPFMPDALTQLGITWIAADNSKQPNPYGLGPATTIPRYPANVYYNVGTFAEQLDEYNFIYYYGCVNTATTTCLSAPATWEQYVNNEATIMLRHLLLNDPRPHYFHQSNLAEDGTLYPVLNEVLARYNKYMNETLLQPLFAGSGTIMAQAAAWAGVNIAVTAYYQNGKVYVLSPVATQVPLTGITTGTLYGGELSKWINVSANTTKTVAAVTAL